jgi:hypothetical protein
MSTEERRQTEQTILALCPHELRLAYMVSQEILKQVVELSTMGINDFEAKTITDNIDALVVQLEHDVAEIKRKMGVEG